MKIKVYIDGQSGTTGLTLGRLIQGMDVELLRIPEEYRHDDKVRAEYMNSADVVFLCLPDDAARNAVGLVSNPNVVIIDASTAHRTAAGWTYGFPEISNESVIASSKRLAVPGCHATGAISVIYPLVKQSVISADYPIAITSLTGYSGGGKKMIAEYESSTDDAFLAPKHYATSQMHKHLPEIVSVCGLTRTPVFCPIVDNSYSGMLVNVPLFADMMKRKMTVEELREFYSEQYKGSCITVATESHNAISAAERAGKDGLTIHVEGNEERIVVYAALDNLIKGAAGAAMQVFQLVAARLKSKQE